ncbi:hypothetical protein DVH24_031205 [Malus domestica]|uniref:Uncharacterized protein n=1 Tax=Malus domestica TaxID=3750 RepID=A0A498HG74_MALDO|nr:hypothetical protein DVH24_031205 [Malus domestica]
MRKVVKTQCKTEEVEPGKFVRKCEKTEQLLRDCTGRLLLVVAAASPLRCIQPLLFLCSMVEERTAVPEDAGLQIVTEFGRRHGKIVRCMGKARVRETNKGLERKDEYDCTGLKDVWPPNPDASTCFTFDFPATLPSRYPLA